MTMRLGASGGEAVVFSGVRRHRVGPQGGGGIG